MILRPPYDIDLKWYLCKTQTITMINFLELMFAMFLAIILIISLPFFFITTTIDVVDEKGLKVLS